MQKINSKVLMSSALYFDDGYAINAHMDDTVKVDIAKACAEHDEIGRCFNQAQIEVIKVAAPENCQDGVYTANWGLVKGNKAVLSNLPNIRRQEESYAEEQLTKLGFNCVKLPEDIRFSGQGDALFCGEYLFVGTTYRTSKEAHAVLENEFNCTVIGVETVPYKDKNNSPVINHVTGWPDSFFYDLDLAIAVIDSRTIAWCPEALTDESRLKIEALTDIDKITVSLEEARDGFACNLVSTGETVVMSNKAPMLKSELEKRGLNVLTPGVSELSKGGGFIRCVSLTLAN